MYKRQESELFQTLNNQNTFAVTPEKEPSELEKANFVGIEQGEIIVEVDENLYALTSVSYNCLLYTSDAADEEDSVDLGGRRIIKKK
ncbi:hypothetical protein JMUB7513_27630 [Staphylococcus aureus]